LRALGLESDPGANATDVDLLRKFMAASASGDEPVSFTESGDNERIVPWLFQHGPSLWNGLQRHQRQVAFKKLLAEVDPDEILELESQLDNLHFDHHDALREYLFNQE
jgi:hypothetical protein